jgi:dolichol-phosphate mannosyltransferase
MERLLLDASASSAAAGPAASQAADDVLAKMVSLGSILRWTDALLVAEVGDRISLRRYCGLALDAPMPTIEDLDGFRRRLSSPTGGLPEPAASAGERPLVSIVSPVFQGAATLEELVRQIARHAASVTPRFEVVLVDDGSSDGSWLEIERLAKEDRRVKGIRMARNFGQHAAITAGLDAARGDWVVVMDCDLQDDPSYIPALLERARQGFDVVYAVRSERRHGWAKNLGGRLFAASLNTLGSGAVADASIGSYSVLSRKAVDGFRSVRETHRHYLGVLRWLDLPSARVPVKHRERREGKSSYTPGRLLRHASNGIATYSNGLLYLGLGSAAVFLCASLIAASILVAMYFLHGFREGWTSTIVLVLLSTSVVLLAIGAIGVYVGKIFEQVKQRPLYLTRDSVNLPDSPGSLPPRAE